MTHTKVRVIQEAGKEAVIEAIHLPVEGESKGWENHSLKNKYNKHHIGETFTTNEGYIVDIIDGGTKKGNVIIAFKDFNYITELRYSDIKRGFVKSPYHKGTLNKGYIGVGKYKPSVDKIKTKAYIKWQRMLYRVYTDNSIAYKNVAMCEEWHNFQNFAKWYYKQPYHNEEGFELDKDLFNDSKFKIYSPETCCLIPRQLNMFIERKTSNKHGYKGVVFDKRDNMYSSRIMSVITHKSITGGYFKTAPEAGLSYLQLRKEQVESLKGILIKEYPLLGNKIIDKLK